MAVLQPYRAAPTGPRPPKEGSSPLPVLKPGKLPGFKAAPGRPESNVGQYLIKPTDKSDTGFEMLNTTPQSVTEAEQKFLKMYELPPALQPKYLRKPEVMERGRSKEISKGWIKPRSQV